MGVIEGDIRSLDYSTYGVSRIPFVTEVLASAL